MAINTRYVGRGSSLFLTSGHDRAHREHQHQQHHLLRRATTNDPSPSPTSSSIPSSPSVQNAFPDSAVAPISSIPTTFASILAGSNSTSLIYISSVTSFTSVTSVSTVPSTSSIPPISSISSASIPLGSVSSASLIAPASSDTLSPSLSESISTLSISSSYLPSSTVADLISSSTTFSGASSTSVIDSSVSSTQYPTYSRESSTLSSTSASSFYSPSPSSKLASSTSSPSATEQGYDANSTPTSTAGAGGDADSDSSSGTSTSTIVGGVIGCIAGAAILVFLLMLLIRWKKRNQSLHSLTGAQGYDAAGATRELPPSQPLGGMTERPSGGGLAALAGLTGLRRSSQRNTMSSAAESERGFYRVSGRKLPSVLHNGGDGYGGGIMVPDTSSASSFYRDSQGFYGSPPLSPPIQRESGVPVMRESPARTPITEQSPFPDIPEALTPPPRQDRIPSIAGSQQSRFTEQV
ncbi:uncharacterized protein L3040_008651 [Drepanopeziza brunnea f. sp. 'multigermtubi']|uniref:uncharacterized protein n=1 Tax=Drepanopeziza brunnea f. sp. 'multigermtubi' TaxID=698441 RepID=UPI0023A2989E|nr:hypothetical protein L3040_008651 [Drepanopeziza brunnea f. sp. 'multigermtubi']